MDEKKTYQVYVGAMKLHKKYFGQKADEEHLNSFVTDVNAMNSMFNSNFCNVTTEHLRQWFIDKFCNVSLSDIAGFYTDMWRLHKKCIAMEQTDDFWRDFMSETERLQKKYPFRQYQWFVLAIADDLELSGSRAPAIEESGTENQGRGCDGEEKK